jgi:hypothetical protein
MTVVSLTGHKLPAVNPQTTWVIGDIQGCLSDLQQLLKAIQFLEGRDRLIFLGNPAIHSKSQRQCCIGQP